MGALGFTSPLILAALASLPLIFLLLRATPPAPKRTPFPAFLILRQLKSAEETPDRTPWPILLMRLLIAALLILALAGPVLNAPAPGAQTGPLVLVVDDSFTAAQAWRVRRDAMREAAAEAQAAGRELFLIATAPSLSPEPVNPMSGAETRDAADSLAPSPFAADRADAMKRVAALGDALDGARAEIRWLSDGVAGPADGEFATALRALGDVALFDDARAPKALIRAARAADGAPFYRIERLSAGDEQTGAIVGTARDGREIARTPFTLAAGERAKDVTLDLPLALANELAAVRIDGVASASAVVLADARDRRALIGIVADADAARDNLLSGAHYVRQALEPYASFLEGSLASLLATDASVIVLNDVGRIRERDMETLTEWVDRGGVLIRFAGPDLAEAAQDQEPALTPVPLRGGGRAFGGALTWDTPQRLAPFPEQSPFAGLAIADDVLIRRQVLAEPGGETTERTWARLQDGTPLVTGLRAGKGVIALFHVTATPDWSDLPISGLFVEMLRRLTFLSALGPDASETGADARYAPLRLLDGAGRLARPKDDARALSAAEIALAPSPERPPGLYGAPEAPFALNAVSADFKFAPLSVPGLTAQPYEPAPPVRLDTPLFVAALLLLLADGLIALLISGKLRLRAATAIIALALAAPLLTPEHAHAQRPLDPEIETKTSEAALHTRLAYIETGDPETDRLSEEGLAALSRELFRRTAVEPAPPEGVDPEADDLSVYSFLYWPIVADAPAPSEAALDNIENFMTFGGLLLIDTRDDERALSGALTPERQAMRRILGELNIPPLAAVDNTHVLTRSFYLLDGLYGRMNDNPVWVAADSSGANDGVTPVIIGGRDWAGAWATDEFGRPLRPIGAGGPRARARAYRAGVNMVMVAFTGNYKSDQVHTPILLERLGRK
ncbi:MAG: DUF4159 domain-containing protein [Parvularculaceae bacterium]